MFYAQSTSAVISGRRERVNRTKDIYGYMRAYLLQDENYQEEKRLMHSRAEKEGGA